MSGMTTVFLRAENLGRLAHEVDAAEGDDVSVGLGGFEAQAERVADKIREILNLAHLVVVGEDDGVRASSSGRGSLQRCRWRQ